MAFNIVNIDWTVRRLADQKRERKLHLPDLQRGFVWSADRVKMLFDSLFRGYPVGALLLWKPVPTGQSPLLTRPWDLFPPNKDGKGEQENLPDVVPDSVFVLDGQQRLTSLFRVMFNSHQRGKKKADPDLWVSLSSSEEWKSDPFQLHSRHLQERKSQGLLVPATVLFAGVRGEDESKAVRDAIREWLRPDEDDFLTALDNANRIRNQILNAKIVTYTIDGGDDLDEDVIEIFVRLNKQGVRLKPGDLASARLTGQMTQFRQRADTELRSEEYRGFVSIDDENTPKSDAPVDTDLLVRTAMFLGTRFIKYSEAEKKKGEDKPFARVEEQWTNACQGLRKTLNYLRTHGIAQGGWLPSRFVVIPPAVAMAKDVTPPKPSFWTGWIIAASLWGHYSKASETKAQADARHAADGNFGSLVDSLRSTSKRARLAPEPEDLHEEATSPDGVLLGILVHLFQKDAKSYPSGRRFGSKADRSFHVHHIFPKDLFPRGSGQDGAFNPDRIGNLTILFDDDNISLGNRKPCEYLAAAPAAFRSNHMIPGDESLWVLDAFDDFCQAREQKLASMLDKLLIAAGIEE